MKPGISPSWSIESWPSHVFPGTPQRARYVLRAHRAELITCGALARVGKELIVLGDRYQRWLERHTADVMGFDIAPNRARQEEPAAA